MDEIITLDYGSGGKKTSRLIEKMIVPALENPALAALGDGAVVNGFDKLAFSTDSFVVDPIFFPGGDIGKLSVCGTVNDLANLLRVHRPKSFKPFVHHPCVGGRGVIIYSCLILSMYVHGICILICYLICIRICILICILIRIRIRISDERYQLVSPCIVSGTSLVLNQALLNQNVPALVESIPIKLCHRH